MKRRLLFIITGDPRLSARPAEAIRIAAGLCVWEKIDVVVSFSGAAVLAISSCTEDFVDEENYTRYLPLIDQAGQPVYVEKDSALLSSINGASVKFSEIASCELAALAAESDFAARF
jgi:hypothetical protein